jgi:hypothetical protein
MTRLLPLFFFALIREPVYTSFPYHNDGRRQPF